MDNKLRTINKNLKFSTKSIKTKNFAWKDFPKFTSIELAWFILQFYNYVIKLIRYPIIGTDDISYNNISIA